MTATRRLAIAVASWLICLGHASVGQTVPVTFIYEGMVDRVSPELASLFSVGDGYTGRVTFDSGAVDRDGDPTRGRYFITNFVMSLGSVGDATTSGSLTISNQPWGDNLRLDAHGFTLSQAGFQLTYLESVLVDPRAMIFADDSLPLVPPAWSDLQAHWFSFGFRNQTGALGPTVGGNVTRVTRASSAAIPEPRTSLLFGLGALGLWACSRRALAAAFGDTEVDPSTGGQPHGADKVATS